MKSIIPVIVTLAMVLAGCSTHDTRNLQEVSSKGELQKNAATASTDPAARPAGVAEKVFTWKELKVGDCRQIEGTLTLRSDGTATFSCVTWTNSTHSGDNWWAGFRLNDHSGVTMHSERDHSGPRMDDGHPTPRYRWGFDFTYDKSHFNEITDILQICKC